jgi:hypothetical protein
MSSQSFPWWPARNHQPNSDQYLGPRKHIDKYPEENRERLLSPAELKRVGEVLREMESEGIELAPPLRPFAC